MKRALFLLAIIAAFSACRENVKELQEENVTKVNNVSVIIDDLLWNGEIGDTIRNSFASPVLGLPQEEPLFTINQFPVKLLEGYMAHGRNIIVVKKEERTRFDIRENQFANPQTVFYISGRTAPEIIDIIGKNHEQIVTRIRQGEVAYIQNMFGKSLADNSPVVKKFKTSILIPSDYRFAIQAENFIWLKKEITSGSNSMLIYEVPMNSIHGNADIPNNIIKVRDSVANLYVHGSVPGTVMVTENSYTPYFFQLKIDNHDAFEIRGTWELDRNMSGPFVTYCIVDEINNRCLIIDGFCYAPSKQKRDLMMELEAMAKSTRFLNINN